MRKFIFLVSMGLSTQAFGAIHPYFLDNTIFTKEQQVELIREIETLCPDAADYQWTLAETRTLITSEKADARVKFRTSFLIISAWMREMSVEAELVPSEKLKISSLKGCSW